MSLGFYPVFNPELKDFKYSYGEALAFDVEALNKIARAAKLTLFTSFADSRPVPDDFDGDPDELAEVMGEWTEWFDPADGQSAMQSLVDHIKANPKAAKRLNDPDGVSAELEELARWLEVAAAQSVQFRLEMS